MSKQTEAPIGTATRALAGDDGTTYDRVAIALHWTTAVLVLVQFLLSQMWGLFGRPAHHLMVAAHMSLGIVLTCVIIGRIAWRLMPGHQIPAIVSGGVALASKAVHYLLYTLLVAEAVLGFVVRWAEGKAMNFFGLLISPPFAAWSTGAHHQIEEWHEKIGWAIILIAVGHAGAALYHHYFLRDRVLLRMLPRLGAR
jgi:cytochrome b561